MGKKVSIELSKVPEYGETVNTTLLGKIDADDPESYKIMVFIYLAERWWLKPSWQSPYCKIDKEGNWKCNINTRMLDEKATKIIAFVLPKDVMIDLRDLEDQLAGMGSQLPLELYNKSPMSKQITRQEK